MNAGHSLKPPHWLERPVVGVVLWLLLIVGESTAQIAMKLGGNELTDLDFGLDWMKVALSDPAVLLAVACHGLTFVAWMLILRSTPVSIAFPLSSLVFVGVLLGSWLVLGEAISLLHGVGVAIIIAGIVLLAQGEQGPG